MDVSVIIVNYNTRQMTSECIDSVFEKTSEIEFEIILVDNGSTDGSKEYFEKDNRIRYIYSNENLGFGRANNLGSKLARGKNLLFLNPDTKLINNAIKKLNDFLDTHLNVAVCGGNLFDKSMNPTHSYRRMYPSMLWEFNAIMFNIVDKIRFGKSGQFNYLGKDIEVAYITGADLMIKKTVFNEVNGFSDQFFMYYEETDMEYKIRKLGYKIFSVPSAHIQHIEGASFNALKYGKKMEIACKSQAIFYKNHYSLNYAKITLLIHKYGCCLKAKMFEIIGNKEKSEKYILEFYASRKAIK